MISIKNKISDIIKKIQIKSAVDKYYTPQIEILDKDKYMNATFLEFLDKISEYTYIDKLDGSSIGRINTDLELKDIIHKAQTAIACGIKIVMNPVSNINEWEKWNNGYIEGFCRMDGDNPQTEWFVFNYIKMDYLEKILKTYDEYLYLL